MCCKEGKTSRRQHTTRYAFSLTTHIRKPQRLNHEGNEMYRLSFATKNANSAETWRRSAAGTALTRLGHVKQQGHSLGSLIREGHLLQACPSVGVPKRADKAITYPPEEALGRRANTQMGGRHRDHLDTKIVVQALASHISPQRESACCRTSKTTSA